MLAPDSHVHAPVVRSCLSFILVKVDVDHPFHQQCFQLNPCQRPRRSTLLLPT